MGEATVGDECCSRRATLEVMCCAAIQSRRRLIVSGHRGEDMEPTFHKFGDLTAEAQAARLLHRRELGFTSVHLLAEEAGLPFERAELLMCRGLSTLLARGYPAEDLCETYRVTPQQLSRAATVPAFSSTFEPLAASR